MFLLQCPCFLTLNHFILFLSSAFSSLSPSYFYSRMPLSMHSKAFHIYWCHLSSKQWTKIINSAAAAQSLQSCQTLSNPIDRSPPGSPVPGILQARTLEWVAISFSNAWKWKVKVKSLSRVRLCDPMDCSLPGSSAHGIFQARVLEWGAIAFSVINSFL